jgi:RNA polymerase sigma factor (sigma-70 family)
MPQEADVAVLLTRINAGDHAARNELLTLLTGPITRLAHRALRGKARAREQTADVVQEVLTELYQRFQGVQTAAHMNALILRLTQNVVIDLYNHHTRQCRDVGRECDIDAFDSDLPKDSSEHTVTPPTRAAEKAEDQHLLRIVMQSLRASDRIVIEMREVRGLPFAAIAAHFEVTEDAARMRYTRAMVELTAAWKRRQQPPPDQQLVASV